MQPRDDRQPSQTALAAPARAAHLVVDSEPLLFRDPVAGVLIGEQGQRWSSPIAELVMEYALPPALRDDTGRTYAEFALPVAAERGEPWRTFLTQPPDLCRLARATVATRPSRVG